MKRVTVFGSIVIFLSCAACTNMPSSNDRYDTLVLTDKDFEDRTIAPWEGLYSTENYSLLIVNESPRLGNYCGKFTIGVNDFWTSSSSGTASARSEMQLFRVAPYHKDVYYGWSLKIPASYAESADWQVIGQFHDQPDLRQGETWSTYPAHSPPLAYNYKNNKLQLAMSTPDNVVRIIWEGAIAKGVWHDIITHVYWSTGNDGFVEAWVDGAPLSVNGITRYYHPNLYNEAGNFLRIGLYRSNAIATENTVFFDEIRSGLTYNEVALN